jgi:prepilin-type processing-associated H-X9-DG protein
VQRKEFLCYLYNSKLNDSVNTPPVGGSPYGIPNLKITQFKSSSEVALMVEAMVTPGERLKNDPVLLQTDSLVRIKTAWTRFSSRHNGGGNILFVDGHVGYFTRKDLLYNPPALSTGDYNYYGKVIWNPLGPSGTSSSTE